MSASCSASESKKDAVTLGRSRSVAVIRIDVGRITTQTSESDGYGLGRPVEASWLADRCRARYGPSRPRPPCWPQADCAGQRGPRPLGGPADVGSGIRTPAALNG